MDVVKRYLEAVKEVAGWIIKDYGDRNRFLILFSDDGDGLSSALLFKLFLDDYGLDYSFICLDKIYPEIVEEVFKEGVYDKYVFLDLGGPIHKLIPVNLVDRVLIIDHHLEYSKIPKNLKYLNPRYFGLSEEDAPVTSAVVYLLFKEVSEKARRWSWLGVLGMGESPYIPSGLNWRVLYDALKVGGIKRRGKSYRIEYGNIRKDFRRLYKDITLISSAGYYKDAYLDMFNSLLNGDNREIMGYVKEYEGIRRDAFDKLKNFLESEGLMVKDMVQWFEDYNKFFYEMGTRIFDSFVSYISYQARLYDKNKYIIGMCGRNPYIPGYGYLSYDWINLAVRVSKALEFRIGIGRSQPVSALLEASAYTVGGLGYGYDTKGSAVIPWGEKDNFLLIFDKLASERV